VRDFLFFVGGFAACMWFVWGVLTTDRWASARRERREVRRPYDHEAPQSPVVVTPENPSWSDDEATGNQGAVSHSGPHHLHVVK